MMRPPPERGRDAAAATDAYAALVRREQQLDAIQRTLGWRLLSHYGPYKRGFVVPAWRRLRGLVRRLLGGSDPASEAYDDWATFADRFHADVRGSDRAHEDSVDGPDLVSVVMLVRHDERAASERAIASLAAQRHRRWDLAVAVVGAWTGDTTSPPLAAGDNLRIRVEPAPYDGEASALDALVAAARGDVVAILPPAVALVPDALGAAVDAFRETGADVLYGDEDHRDADGRRHGPRFLPGWSPDLLLSTMYWPRVVFFRREMLAGLLPFRAELDGAHGYDLALRSTEGSVRVVHVPRVLAHVEAAVSMPKDRFGGERDPERRALELAVERRGLAATVARVDAGIFRVRRAVVAPAKVSIVIPTRDGFRNLRRCLAALERTQHGDFEVLLVDNGSRDPATLELLAASGHRVLRAPGPFNFARLNNDAVRESRGRYVLFLNDDTEPTDPLWLTALEEHAQRPEVGAVGAKLLYGDGRIQHAGIATGIGGIAGHPGRFRRAMPTVVRNVSAVTAACLMARREVFDAIGGFDEALPVNSNDVDLCLRLRARGYLVVYTPHAVVRHYESQTRGTRAVSEDVWLMMRRWRQVLPNDPYYSPNLTMVDETGEPDLSKPDGWTLLYAGTTRAEGRLQLASGGAVGQTFFATGADLAAIVVYATNTEGTPGDALRLAVREAPEASEPIRVVDRSIAGRSPDERWFCFAPIRESADRFWYFSLEATGPGAVMLRRQNAASDVMGPCRENGVPAFGTLQFQLYGRAPNRCAVS
ncbi:MAG: glycosyltransferase family 2 protein [Deltaproteobacteria bacterium]|nr:glycosyltransferase family 2 protein [Deltaproteobacteria bacterium]